MLHLIIPPIVIVISIVLLLLFLSRKVSNLSDAESEALKKGSRDTEITKKVKNFSFSKISKFSLNFLELTTQRFKVIFLKFHNIFDKWFRSIREKKRKRNLEASQGNSKRASFREIISKRRKRKRLFLAGLPKNREVNKIKEDERREKESRPMISQEIVQPESQPATKNKFEEILIKRIAANPRDLEAYERLGDYYIEQGSIEDALECYRQVLKLSPVNYKAKIKTKKLEKILGD